MRRLGSSTMRLVFAASLTVAACPEGRAVAAPITFVFIGTVEEVFDGLGALDDSIEPGTTVLAGSYTFDSETPNTAEPVDEGEAGLYHHNAPPAGVRVHVGNFTFRSVSDEPDFDILVNNNIGFTGADEYGFRSRSNEALGLQTGVPVDRLEIDWFASTLHGNPLDSAALPITPPDLQLLGGGQLTIEGECTLCAGPAAFFRINGTLTSLTLIPEPSTVTLLSMIAVGLLAYTLRRRKRAAWLPHQKTPGP